MEIEIVLEKHERRIDELEHEMAGLKAVQNEIRTMNETLCVLTNEKICILSATSASWMRWRHSRVR